MAVTTYADLQDDDNQFSLYHTTVSKRYDEQGKKQRVGCLPSPPLPHPQCTVSIRWTLQNTEK